MAADPVPKPVEEDLVVRLMELALEGYPVPTSCMCGREASERPPFDDDDASIIKTGACQDCWGYSLP
jgi:hypothetical protein